jgi:hypothetical protein
MPIMLAMTPRPSTMSTITDVKDKISKANVTTFSSMREQLSTQPPHGAVPRVFSCGVDRSDRR